MASADGPNMSQAEYLDLVTAIQTAFDQAFLQDRFVNLAVDDEVGLVVTSPAPITPTAANALQRLASEELRDQRARIVGVEPTTVAVRMVTQVEHGARAAATLYGVDDPSFRQLSSEDGPATQGHPADSSRLVGGADELVVVPRVAFTHAGHRRSASIGTEWIELGANSSFAFRHSQLPSGDAGTGLYVNYDEDLRLVRFCIAGGSPWRARIWSAEADWEPLPPNVEVAAELEGVIELTSAEGTPAPWEVAYAIEASSEWVPSTAEIEQLMRRAARAFGLSGIRQAEVGYRTPRFGVFVEGDAPDQIRDVPALCVYGRRDVDGGSAEFLKFYFLLNGEDQRRLFERLVRAERQVEDLDRGVVATRHRLLLEEGGTSTVHEAGGTIDTPDFQNLQLHAIVAVSRWVRVIRPDAEPGRLRLDALREIALGIDVLHGRQHVFGDVKTANAAYVQRLDEDARWMLVDLDSVAPARIPVGAARFTPGYALPALVAVRNRIEPRPDLLYANDWFGFAGLVVALLSGQETARHVLRGGSYDDPMVSRRVRGEIVRRVEELRQVTETSAPAPSVSCADWLDTLLELGRQAEAPLGRSAGKPSRSELYPEVAALKVAYVASNRSIHTGREVFDEHCRSLVDRSHKVHSRAAIWICVVLFFVLLKWVVL